MNLENSKERLKSLLEKRPESPLSPAVHEDLIACLDDCSTASEFAARVAKYIPDLFKAYSYELIDTLKGTLSPMVWLNNGVLINPDSIPLEGPDKLIVLGNGLVRQNVEKEVTYLGDMIVNVSAGVAHVWDTYKYVNVELNGKVIAHGHTRVNAYDQAEVSCYDFSKVTAYDGVVVHAYDRSCAVGIHDDVTLFAHDQAQFYVNLGQPEIFMYDSARGCMEVESNPLRPIKVHLNGMGLLYAKAIHPEDIQLLDEGFSGTIIRGENTPKMDSVMMEVVVPRYAKTDKEEVGIAEPLPLSELKQELDSWMGDNYPPLDRCTNETEVCALLRTFLPSFLDKGMTGEFLRSHFTKAALEANLIHAFSQTEASIQDRDVTKTHYFFGSQLVHGDFYKGNVDCYEQCLLVSAKGSHVQKVGDQAQAIVVEQGKVIAKDRSRVVSFDNGRVQAFDRSTAIMNGNSVVVSYDQAIVYGHQDAYVNAKHDSIVFMDDRANATVDDRVRVLAEGKNHVTARGGAVVGYADYHPRVDVSVTMQSEHAKEVKLNTHKQYTNFFVSLRTKVNQAKQQGLKR